MRAEMLPSGPAWRAKPWETTYPLLAPVQLYYRDPLECLQSLLISPLLADSVDFSPYRLYETSEKLIRKYDEWMSGDAAWEMQVIFFSAINVNVSSLVDFDLIRNIFQEGPPSSAQFYLLIRPIYLS